MENKPWLQGAVWETNGWVWRGCEPPHPTTPRPWRRQPTQLRFKFTAPPTP